MFQLGDQVIYGIHGVCTIVDIERRTVDRKQVEYFVLKPTDQSDARYYVPTHNQAAVAKLRPVITQKELDQLLHSKEVSQDAWIADENQRKQHYRELITSGDRAALVRMVHTLYRHRKEQLDSGKKFHLCDENFLRDAEKLLTSEFSLVLNIDQKEVQSYVKAILNKE